MNKPTDIFTNASKKYILLLGALTITPFSFAGSSWLSRSIPINNPDGFTSSSYLHRHTKNSLTKSIQPSSQTLFDLTVSLHNSPEPSQRSVYEDTLSYFADAVCEQTNGSHKLQNIHIFKNNKHQAKADIIWSEKAWPKANISGFGNNGMHMWIGDVFPNAGGPGKDFNMLSNPKGAGYTLGHEWAHYAYGLFDEYQGASNNVNAPSMPQKSDIPTKSIMNNQWYALSSGYSWLNHSTIQTIGDPLRTAQGRIYGKSAWEVLQQDPINDPKTGIQTAQPARTQYVALNNNAPSALNNIKIELPDLQANCRENLNFIWVEGDLDMQVLIDISGSMEGEPMENAKQATNLLLDATGTSDIALGIVTISSGAMQNFKVQELNNTEHDLKSLLQEKISELPTGGATALYDGLNLGITGLANYQETSLRHAPSAVFVLSDGDDNRSSKTIEQLIELYQNNKTPIFSFGYGDASPTGPLLNLANSTGGKYYSSPTSLSEITNAFLQANATVSDSQNTLALNTQLESYGTQLVPLDIDSGIDDLNIFINSNTINNDLSFSLLSPAGKKVNALDFKCSSLTSSQICSGIIANSLITSEGRGQWQLAVKNNANTDVELSINASATPNNKGTFDVSIESATGNSVSYPHPFIVTTAVTNTNLITGVDITATLTDPDNEKLNILMFDDGSHGDALAEDGIYSAIIAYNKNGTYQLEAEVSNNSAKARYTSNGTLSPTLDGGQVEPEQFAAITENFSRISKATVVISNVPEDDNNDDFSSAQLIQADNSETQGVIDKQGDVDVYKLESQALTSDSKSVLRVSAFSLGFEPVVNLYNGRHEALLVDAKLNDYKTDTGYFYTELDLASYELNDNSALFISVKHQDKTATQGAYKLSVGKKINTDVAENAGPIANDDTHSLWRNEKIIIKPLDNDTDADNDQLSIIEFDTETSIGAISWDQANQSFSYQASGFEAFSATGTEDRFSYVISDGKGKFSKADVLINVNFNNSPIANDDKFSLKDSNALTIEPLINDSDLEGHKLSITAIDTSSIKGQASLSANNIITYQAPVELSNNDLETITYTVEDEHGGSDIANIIITSEQHNTVIETKEDVNKNEVKSIEKTEVKQAAKVPTQSSGGGSSFSLLLILINLILAKTLWFRKK